LVETLADAHLIEAGAGERYYFHRPLREVARTRALHTDGREACHAAVRRVVAFYAGTLHNCLHVLNPADLPLRTGLSFSTVEDAQAWFRTEQQNLWSLTTQNPDFPEAPVLAELLTTTTGVLVPS
jgi:hypothetical protein